MSIVLVLFPGAPTVSVEALQHDRELNVLIEKRIAEMIRDSAELELNNIIQTLAEEELPGLPPGGGILAKRSFIEEVYSKLKPLSPSPESVRNQLQDCEPVEGAGQ